MKIIINGALLGITMFLVTPQATGLKPNRRPRSSSMQAPPQELASHVDKSRTPQARSLAGGSRTSQAISLDVEEISHPSRPPVLDLSPTQRAAKLHTVLMELWKSNKSATADDGEAIADRKRKLEQAAFRWINYEADVAWQNHAGNSALHLAAMLELPNIMAYMLRMNATIKVNLQNNQGITPLYAAVNRRNIATITLLLAHGADIRMANHEGISPLDIAKGNKDNELETLLIAEEEKYKIKLLRPTRSRVGRVQRAKTDVRAWEEEKPPDEPLPDNPLN